MLTVHKTVPRTLKMIDETGTTFTFGDLRGKWVVVYFYPRDNTPGCTVEAEGFRDNLKKFETLGAWVLGVSKDSCASHNKFIEKKQLNFTLIADTEHVLMEKFGTWQQKKFMGREYMGTTRSTFLIDPNGKIAQVWETVKPAGHAEEVLAILREKHKAYEQFKK